MMALIRQGVVLKKTLRPEKQAPSAHDHFSQLKEALSRINKHLDGEDEEEAEREDLEQDFED